ncbi:MAG: AAA family ATPase [Holosporaceae bacterium]|nr:AAA family ATPase [Holosporaceae bacterium]
MEKVHKILGHEKEEALLARAISFGRVFPTWIFYGPYGVGKASIATRFAKCLLSNTISDGNTLDTLDICDDDVHKRVDMRTHPDFFVLEQTNESISIDDTRKLLAKVRKSPALSRRRVVLLENSSNLNKNIYNSLLKMLEEPPRDTVIIMICNHLEIIPKTLLSRAMKICFHPLSEESVKQILDEMNISNSSKLSQLSEGSVGYALRLNANNGVEIYENILNGFRRNGSEYQKTLKWIIDNNLCENFDIIKFSILRILKIYVDMLSGTAIADEKFSEEMKVLEPLVDASRAYPDSKIKKIQEIIHLMGLCDHLILDRNAVVVNAFERFFKN